VSWGVDAQIGQQPCVPSSLRHRTTHSLRQLADSPNGRPAWHRAATITASSSRAAPPPHPPRADLITTRPGRGGIRRQLDDGAAPEATERRCAPLGGHQQADADRRQRACGVGLQASGAPGPSRRGSPNTGPPCPFAPWAGHGLRCACHDDLCSFKHHLQELPSRPGSCGRLNGVVSNSRVTAKELIGLRSVPGSIKCSRCASGSSPCRQIVASSLDQPSPMPKPPPTESPGTGTSGTSQQGAGQLAKCDGSHRARRTRSPALPRRPVPPPPARPRSKTLSRRGANAGRAAAS